jgi:hypothetical protein
MKRIFKDEEEQSEIYTFEASEDYLKIEAQFEFCLETHNPNGISYQINNIDMVLILLNKKIELFQKHPWYYIILIKKAY